MKRVIIPRSSIDTIELKDIPKDIPIFAKKDSKFIGMVFHEGIDYNKRRWILRVHDGCYKHYKSRSECIKDGMERGYKFYIMEMKDIK